MSGVWTVQPPSGTSIDWSHPLAYRLKHCWPLNGCRFDLAGGAHAVLGSGLSYAVAGGVVGLQVSTAGAFATAGDANGSGGPGAGPFSIAGILLATQWPSTSNTAFYGTTTSSVAETPEVLIKYANHQLALNAADIVSAISSPFPNNSLAFAHPFVFTYDGTTVKEYIDGEMVASQAYSTAFATAAQFAIHSGAKGADASVVGNMLSNLCTWDYALSPALSWQFSQNPWQVFDPEYAP